MTVQKGKEDKNSPLPPESTQSTSAVFQSTIPMSGNERLAPRSILRHRPIEESPRKTRKIIEKHTDPPQMATRTSRAENDVEAVYEPISEWSSKRTRTKQWHVADNSVARGGKSTANAGLNGTSLHSIWENVKGSETAKHWSGLKGLWTSKKKQHPSLYLGLGMIVALVLWLVLSTLSNWIFMQYNDMRFGRPRTYQTDQWVGHGEQTGKPSHFIAVNLNRKIQVVEWPGGDATKAKVYMGPQLYSAEDELMPVELKFSDLNNDKKTDMIVLFRESQVVYINQGDVFRQMSAAEREQVEKALKKLG